MNRSFRDFTPRTFAASSAAVEATLEVISYNHVHGRSFLFIYRLTEWQIHVKWCDSDRDRPFQLM